MSGARYLLDTNIVIGLLKGHTAVVSLMQERGLNVAECAYSSITRMELLGFPDITDAEERAIAELLARLAHCPITAAVEDAAIALRRQRKLKLPDAIIAATATVHGLELLTLDQDLTAAAKGT